MASYSNKSFDEILSELLKMTKSEIKQFTNYKDTDPLVILHKLIAALYVAANAYSSKYLNSEYIQKSSIIDRKSMFLLLEKFDMTPRKVIPGTIDVMFEYVENPTNYSGTDNTEDEDQEHMLITEPVLIPAGTEFLVGDVPFTILDDYYIKAYNSYVNIRIIEGSYRVENFYKSNIYNNRLVLGSEIVSDDYVKLLVDGEEFSKISNAIYTDESKVFSVELDINGKFNIVFSDKAILDINDSSNIEVRYIESTGNQEYDAMSDRIEITSKVMYNNEDIHNKIVQNVVTGYLIGDNYHTEPFNYKKISSVFPTFRNIVTTNDYRSLTNYYPGVAISASYDSNSERALEPELNIRNDNLVKVVVAPWTGYFITDALREDLYKYYREVGLSKEEVFVELLNPNYIVVNLVIGVSTVVENQSELLNIYNSIESAIKDYFKVGNIDFQSLLESDYIASLVFKVSPRIDYVDVLEFSDSKGTYFNQYQLNAVELPILGNLEILFTYKKIVVMDDFRFSDKVSYRDVTYYLQGNRGEIMRMSDSSELRHEMVDEIANFTEDRAFGYFSEFDIEFSQDDTIIISDCNSDIRYMSFSKTTVSTKYSSSHTDDALIRDDLQRTDKNSLISDRVDKFTANYDY